MEDWRDKRACRDVDPDVFYPEKVGSRNMRPTQFQIAKANVAKAICRECEVQEACLTWAIDAGEDDGVWGGMAEWERRSLRASRALQAPHAEPYKHGTSSGWNRHVREGVQVCDECREWRNKYNRDLRANRDRRVAS